MQVKVNFRGSTLKFLLIRRSDFSSFYQVYVENSYKELLNCINQGDVIIDAGANIGVFSVLAAKLVGPQGFVYAVEPDPENVAILSKNIEINDLKNISIISKALWESSNVALELLQKGVMSKLKVLAGAQNEEGEKAPISVVPTITFDEIVERAIVELSARPTALKMDIEGAEKFALKSANKLMKNIRCLEAEIHDEESEVTLREFSEFEYFEHAPESLRPVLEFMLKNPLLVANLELHNRFKTSLRIIKEKLGFRQNAQAYPKIIYGLRLQK